MPGNTFCEFRKVRVTLRWRARREFDRSTGTLTVADVEIRRWGKNKNNNKKL